MGGIAKAATLLGERASSVVGLNPLESNAGREIRGMLPLALHLALWTAGALHAPLNSKVGPAGGLELGI